MARSIYAQNNDLVVLAPVNAGAQVIADGHVHIYAKLRGRAVAGAKGLAGARVFVQKLEAELVAVSDAYMSAEEIPHALRGKSAQIWLEDGQCKAAPLVIKKFGRATERPLNEIRSSKGGL